MRDEGKTRQQLIDELAELRRRVAAMNAPATAAAKTDAGPASGNPHRLGAASVESSERPSAEEALRKSEERFDLAIRGAGVGIWDYDILRGTVFYSARWKAMFGYREDEIGDRLDDWAGLLHPEERDQVLKLQNDFLAGTEPQIRAEYRLRHKDGSYRWIEAHGVVVRDAEGIAIRLVGSHGDITDRKRAEEALRASEARFRGYFEQGLVGMAVTSVEGRWVEVNDRLCRTLGYSREELASKTWIEMTHAEDRSEDLSQFRRLLAGEIEHYSLEKRFVRKDGTLAQAAIFIRAIRRNDGSVDHIVALLADITDRKRAEEALRRSYEQLRAIYDGMVDGLTIEDIESRRIVRANAALCRMLGVSEEEAAHLRLEDVHPPQSLPMIMEEYQAHAEGRAGRSEAIPFVDRKGNLFYADITSSRIVYEGKSCVICFIHDITARKKAEDALERERQALWRMLQSSDHERRIIAYDIHDGLAQYLGGATMQFQAYESLRESSPDRAKKAYDTAVELVHQAHCESRRLVSEVRPPVIDEIGLETAIVHLVHEQRRRGSPEVAFHSNVRFGRLASILENGLYRIAQECLANACRHSRSKRVALSLTQEGQEACLKVEDWGIGFDPDSVAKGHFGLEGIRQRVRLLGGRLTIQSRPGSGTVVQVIVPMLERHAEARQDGIANGEIGGGLSTTLTDDGFAEEPRRPVVKDGPGAPSATQRT